MTSKTGPPASARASPRKGFAAVRLDELIEEATVDAYGDSDQTTGFLWTAYSIAKKIAERVGKTRELRADIRRIAISVQDGGNLIAHVLGRELGMPSP